jgi:hypothetical protein
LILLGVGLPHLFTGALGNSEGVHESTLVIKAIARQWLCAVTA